VQGHNEGRVFGFWEMWRAFLRVEKGIEVFAQLKMSEEKEGLMYLHEEKGVDLEQSVCLCEEKV
jgi:hypothetical protein